MSDNAALPLPDTTPDANQPNTPAPSVFACDTWLYSKKHKEGKLFLAGEPYPDAKEGFTDTPANL